jgi:hypothetical protein
LCSSIAGTGNVADESGLKGGDYLLIINRLAKLGVDSLYIVVKVMEEVAAPTS